MMKIINTRVPERKHRHKNLAAITLAALLVSSFGLSIGFGTTAFAAEQVCSTITLASGSTTQTAGFTETNPVAHPLTVASYAHTYDFATNTVTIIPPWVDPLASADFSGGSSRWISSATTSPGAMGNTEGLANADQWRLFKDSFTLPANATLTAADIWYTADNAAAVYSNDLFVQSTGGVVEDVFGLVPPNKPAVYSNVYHTIFSPVTGTNTLNFVVRNWGGAFTSNPTGLLYKAVVNYCATAGATTTPPTNNLGSLMVKKLVVGGTATSSDFLVHVMKSGVEVSGSPKAGSSTGTLYSGLLAGTSSYMLSETGGPANYTLDMSGECSPSGMVTISASTTKTCTLMNTYVAPSTTPTTTPPTNNLGSLMVKKLVVGGTATSSDFLIHVMKNGVEVSGSPKAGTATGTMYSGLATSSGAYIVSETGVPANYALMISGDCSASGTVMISGSMARNCTLTNTFVSGTTTGTTTPPVPDAGPRQDKQNVLDELIALRDAHAACTLHMKQLNVAIIHLQASLADDLWVDNDHVSAHNGDKVFDEEQESVKALQKLVEDSDSDVDDSVLQGFIVRLAQADRDIANIAITDAKASGGSHWKIARASKMLERGDTALANENVLRAMWRFQKAWGFAITSYQ